MQDEEKSMRNRRKLIDRSEVLNALEDLQVNYMPDGDESRAQVELLVKQGAAIEQCIQIVQDMPFAAAPKFSVHTNRRSK